MSNVVYLLPHQQVAREDSSNEMLPDICPVAVLFLSHGRNAWHSTWIRQYHPGSFFRDGRDVKAAVAKRKTPGTVFYMSVLPAIQARFGNRTFVITEINTDEPFRHIDLMEARFGLLGSGLSHFLARLDPSSRLWKPSQAKADRIIVQEVSEGFIDLFSYTLLSKGRDAGNNPPIGKYRRQISGTFAGDTEWYWKTTHQAPNKMSLRWFNKALEAVVESRERLAEHQASLTA